MGEWIEGTRLESVDQERGVGKRRTGYGIYRETAKIKRDLRDCIET